MERWHTLPPVEIFEPRARLRDQLVDDELAIFSDVHGSGELINYFRKKLYGLADVMKRTGYLWELNWKDAQKMYAKAHGALPPDGYTNQQLYVMSIGYDTLEYTLNQLDPQSDADRDLVGHMMEDDRDKRHPDCRERSPDIWVDPYRQTDYTYRTNSFEFGPYFGSGRDPINNWGLVHRSPAHSYNEDRLITWICCGQERDDPGCWHGKSKGEYTPLDISPGEGWVEAVELGLDIKKLWEKPLNKVTYWLDVDYYKKLENEIQQMKLAISDELVVYMRTRFADELTDELRGKLEEILRWEKHFNEVYCNVPPKTVDGLLMRREVLEQLARGVLLENVKMLQNNMKLDTLSDMNVLVDTLQGSGLDDFLAWAIETRDVYNNQQTWFVKTPLVTKRYTTSKTVEVIELTNNQLDVVNTLREYTTNTYKDAVSLIRANQTPMWDDLRDERSEIVTNFKPPLSKKQLNEIMLDYQNARLIRSNLEAANKQNIEDLVLKSVDSATYADLVLAIDTASILLDRPVFYENVMATYRANLEQEIAKVRKTLKTYENEVETKAILEDRAKVFDAMNIPDYPEEILEEYVVNAQKLETAKLTPLPTPKQIGIVLDTQLYELNWDQDDKAKLVEAEKMRQLEANKAMLLEAEKQRQMEKQLLEAKKMRQMEAEEAVLLQAKRYANADIKLENLNEWLDRVKAALESVTFDNNLPATSSLLLNAYGEYTNYMDLIPFQDVYQDMQVIGAFNHFTDGPVENWEKEYRPFDKYPNYLIAAYNRGDFDALINAWRAMIYKMRTIAYFTIDVPDRFDVQPVEPSTYLSGIYDENVQYPKAIVQRVLPFEPNVQVDDFEQQLLPKAGPIITKSNFDNTANSCWTDTILAAIFKLPETPFEGHIRNAKVLNLVNLVVIQHNGLGQTVTQCGSKEAGIIHSEILKDIMELQIVSKDQPYCRSRKVWSSCVRYPVENEERQSARLFMEDLFEVYEFGAQEFFTARQEDTRLEIFQVANDEATADIVVIDVEPVFGKNPLYDSVIETLESHKLVSVLMFNGNHYISKVLDPRTGVWWAFDATAAEKSREFTDEAFSKYVPMLYVYLKTDYKGFEVPGLRETMERLRNGDTTGLPMPFPLSKSLLNDEFRLRAAAQYILAKDPTEKRKAAATAQFEYEMTTGEECYNVLVGFLDNINAKFDVSTLEPCLRAISNLQFSKDVLSEIAIQTPLYRDGKWSTDIKIVPDLTDPEAKNGAVWLPADEQRSYVVFTTYVPNQLWLSKLVAQMAYVAFASFNRVSPKRFEYDLFRIYFADNTQGVIKALQAGTSVLQRNVESLALKLPENMSKKSTDLLDVYRGEIGMDFLQSFLEQEDLPQMLQEIDYAEIVGPSEAFRFQALVYALITYTEQGMVDNVRKYMAIASVAK